jgi:catechol 2,3-dioxygenase-like lactoylglutathione lyase family enzyme
VPDIRLDHIALAVPRMAEAPAFLVGALGGTPSFGALSGAYRFGQWRFAGGGRLEILEPHGADGFLHRFLARHGPGIHHVTFKVPSLREARARAEAHGYQIVGYDDRSPHWKEAFLHPKQAQGIVVQLAEFSGGGTPPRSELPAGPPDPPPPVTIVGLRLRAHSRERAETQWERVLEGEPAMLDGVLLYRWPRSPLRIAVEIDPAGDEGPLAIEVQSDRTLALPPGKHPVLGAVFSTAR